MTDRPLTIASIADWGAEWRWIERAYGGVPPIDFRFFSAQRGRLLAKLPGPHWGRIRAAWQLRRALRRGGIDLVVSNTPRTSHYASALSLKGMAGIPHLATGFNFTDLPTGYRLDAMRKSFARIDRLLVFTEMERHLYARLFGLPVDRFGFTHWGVNPPIAAPLARTIAEPYVAAIGGEARDYATLAAAALRLPSLRFVAVVRPASFDGIAVPPNLTVLVNRPWEETWSLAAHAEAMLVPLRSSETPNGIVTIVGGMHLGRAQVVTDSTGVHDYLADGETALLAPAGDAAAFAAAIERLRDEPALRERLGGAARDFAAIHCTEQASAASSLREVLALTGRAGAGARA